MASQKDIATWYRSTFGAMPDAFLAILINSKTAKIAEDLVFKSGCSNIDEKTRLIEDIKYNIVSMYVHLNVLANNLSIDMDTLLNSWADDIIKGEKSLFENISDSSDQDDEEAEDEDNEEDMIDRSVNVFDPNDDTRRLDD